MRNVDLEIIHEIVRRRDKWYFTLRSLTCRDVEDSVYDEVLNNVQDLLFFSFTDLFAEIDQA